MSCIRLVKVSRSLYSKTTIGDPDEIRAIAEILIRDTNYTVTDMLSNDRIREIFHKEVAALLAQLSSRPRSFSKSIGGGKDRSRRRSTSRTRPRRGQPIVATSATGQQQMGRLLYVNDRESRLRFLVDTGSEVSILPPSKAEWTNRQDTFEEVSGKGG